MGAGTGEARRLCAPHSSSGQTALYSGRPAGEGIPHTAPLPPCTPSRHCDSRPLRVRQSRRFLETGSLFPPLVAAFQTAFEMPFPALLRGFWQVETCGLLPIQPHMSMKKLGVFPDTLSFSFCCRTLALWDGLVRFASLPQPPGCGSKTGAGSIWERPFHRSPVTAKVRQQNRREVHPVGTWSFVDGKGRHRS